MQWIWNTKNYTKNTEKACALTEVFFSSSSASTKAYSSECTASSVNCVTVSVTVVNVLATKWIDAYFIPFQFLKYE